VFEQEFIQQIQTGAKPQLRALVAWNRWIAASNNGRGLGGATCPRWQCQMGMAAGPECCRDSKSDLCIFGRALLEIRRSFHHRTGQPVTKLRRRSCVAAAIGGNPQCAIAWR
jgi:hypothetical protein